MTSSSETALSFLAKAFLSSLVNAFLVASMIRRRKPKKAKQRRKTSVYVEAAQEQARDFVIVDPIEEGDKVKGEICFILLPDHIKHLLEEDNWPKQFKAAAEKKLGNARSSEGDAARASRSHDGDDEDGSDGGDGETNDDWMMMRNPNRMCSEDDDDSSADEDEESS
ncbi:hypothetical protein PTSG_06055 [Salpingoeca rosetta]|uniref:S1-like domain-containing protein n=1 Tax=Salpingoeca rosetta (strain ATCC 50818 / BSB-021) TaxID=946362 RepID=F2UDJ9_SALR5|nr:uncharacterized protein PTSG_06055 [Salpingoeca rosetta]EGD74694.1 hypothetical protein PTSG_06055 [Salpingoeca rosetta]|eukprot:XP_004992951.1 hypothetical protein PTSG_06055 [Salpingoeca rosetta]